MLLLALVGGLLKAIGIVLIMCKVSIKALRKMLGITAAATLLTWMAREKTEGAIRLAESTEVLTPPAYMKAAAEFIHNA